jgi:site-specific DNA recombinase
MSPEAKRQIRCAIYTRKSSEEGLEQSFNSLDAQREACQAFITSQRQEGWRALPGHYDDGGYSGGTMERPALQRLLKEIEEGKVDTIVVYKVDRLTRSLADFAKIVEALDARGVSFVSVTQQFNTTSSMGRLTLNVLLSFAQFEREVTGERIRDKIAASKRKGMWMGGRVPIGYDVKERKLIVNPEETDLVRRLFHLYLELGSVLKLKAQLDREAITSKERTNASGNRSGGTPYSRGALYRVLQNPIYRGDIQHHGKVYPGEHTGIISRELWEQVQAQLRSDNGGRRGVRANCSSLLAGLLQDAEGNRFASSHTVKNGKRYRYYVCQEKVYAHGTRSKPTRVPAHDVERQVSLRLQAFLQSASEVMAELTQPEDPPASTQQIIAAARKQSEQLHSDSPSFAQNFLRKVVRRVVVHPDRIELEVSKGELHDALAGAPGAASRQGSFDIIRLALAVRIKRCGGEVRLVIPPHFPGRVHPVPSLLKVVARAHQWCEWIISGKVWGGRSIAEKTGLDERYASQILECAFLAPDIVEAILDGRQPESLTWKKLTRHMPMNWVEQRKRLGSPPASFTATNLS